MSAETTLVSQESFKSQQIHQGEQLGRKQYSQAKKAEEGLRDFQGLLVNLMLSSMRGTVQKSEMFNGGQGEEIFQEMLDQEYSKKMSSNNVLGLDSVLRRSFRLPMNETFAWQDVEALPSNTLQDIQMNLQKTLEPREMPESTNEPVSASVSKALDLATKKRNLLEALPKDVVDKLDVDYLTQWKARRATYLDNIGYQGQVGVGLRNLNKELLQTIYPALKFQNHSNQKVDFSLRNEAYKKVIQGDK